MRASRLRFSATHCAALISVLVAGCGWASTQLVNQPTPEPPPPTVVVQKGADDLFGVGTTDAVVLFKYHHRPDLPAYCGDPSGLLERIKAAISPTSSCSITQPHSAGRSSEDMLEFKCTRGDPESDCTDIYDAHLWVQRAGNDETNGYSLLIQGFSRSICPRGPHAASRPFAADLARPSAAVEALLDKCR